MRALQEHLGDRAEASCRAGTNYRIRYRLPEKRPKVSIVIPTRDACDLVRNCIESIAKNTSYSSYEIVVVDNGSRDEAHSIISRDSSDKDGASVSYIIRSTFPRSTTSASASPPVRSCAS